MKAGFTISIAAHIIAIAILLVSFSSPPLPENPQTEEVPITLVPMSDVMALQKGEATAPKKQKAAQKPTQNTPQVKPDAENAGNGKIDTPLPENPKLKAREVKTPPPPKGEAEGKTEPAPQKPAEQPKPAPQQPAPPKPAEPVKAAPPKPAPAAPQSDNAPSDNIGDLLKTEQPQQQPAPAKPQPAKQPEPAPEKPKTAPKPQEETPPAIPADKAPLPVARPEQPKPAPRKGDAEGAGAADSHNALIDRTKTSGGGAKRSETEAAFGAQKNIGNGDNLQQTLNNIIGSCVARNWDIGLIQGSNAYNLQVQVHFRLNKDGSLNGDPDFSPSGGDLKDQQVIVQQARAAIQKCAPFKLPPEKYEQWHDVTMNMRAFPQ